MGGMCMRNLSVILGLLLFLLAGCNNNFQPELTRIDAQKISFDGTKNGEERIIADKQSLQAIEQAMSKVTWEPNTKADMARREDAIATFFVQEEKNMPERLYEYRIWFEGETATIISSKENEGYGRLVAKDQVHFLEAELLD
ncbi:hypothetical protein [Mesobacillus subterraneus]|uniref:hypothetical protein n=1 Tax=Mesobacillus subterraneus TaxID=285983 RepID=UPI002040B0AD|nr:hypothetical protein [Mesobacillus subterraneus]MCM3685181.1 hypothetical protein [Mesobacillus subterraneus]